MNNNNYNNKESVSENEMLKIPWDFGIQTDLLKPTRGWDQVMIKKTKKKRNLHPVDFDVLVDDSENQRKRKEKQLFGPCQWTKNAMEHDSDDDSHCKWCARKGAVKSWKSEDESRQSKLQHCWDWLEYWEESRRPEETCCNSNSSKGVEW